MSRNIALETLKNDFLNLKLASEEEGHFALRYFRRLSNDFVDLYSYEDPEIRRLTVHYKQTNGRAPFDIFIQGLEDINVHQHLMLNRHLLLSEQNLLSVLKSTLLDYYLTTFRIGAAKLYQLGELACDIAEHAIPELLDIEYVEADYNRENLVEAACILEETIPVIRKFLNHNFSDMQEDTVFWLTNTFVEYISCQHRLNKLIGNISEALQILQFNESGTFNQATDELAQEFLDLMKDDPKGKLANEFHSLNAPEDITSEAVSDDDFTEAADYIDAHEIENNHSGDFVTKKVLASASGIANGLNDDLDVLDSELVDLDNLGSSSDDSFDGSMGLGLDSLDDLNSSNDSSLALNNSLNDLDNTLDHFDSGFDHSFGDNDEELFTSTLESPLDSSIGAPLETPLESTSELLSPDIDDPLDDTLSPAMDGPKTRKSAKAQSDDDVILASVAEEDELDIEEDDAQKESDAIADATGANSSDSGPIGSVETVDASSDEFDSSDIMGFDNTSDAFAPGSDAFSNEGFGSDSPFDTDSNFDTDLDFGEDANFSSQNAFEGADNFNEDNFNSTDAFDSNDSFNADDTFNADDSFSASGSFASSDSFESSDTFEDSDSFEGSDTFENNDSFSSVNAFDSSNSFASNDTFGDDDTFVEDDAFGVDDTFTAPTDFDDEEDYEDSLESSGIFDTNHKFEHPGALTNGTTISLSRFGQTKRIDLVNHDELDNLKSLSGDKSLDDLDALDDINDFATEYNSDMNDDFDDDEMSLDHLSPNARRNIRRRNSEAKKAAEAARNAQMASASNSLPDVNFDDELNSVLDDVGINDVSFTNQGLESTVVTNKPTKSEKITSLNDGIEVPDASSAKDGEYELAADAVGLPDYTFDSMRNDGFTGVNSMSGSIPSYFGHTRSTPIKEPTLATLNSAARAEAQSELTIVDLDGSKALNTTATATLKGAALVGFGHDVHGDLDNCLMSRADLHAAADALVNNLTVKFEANESAPIAKGVRMEAVQGQGVGTLANQGRDEGSSARTANKAAGSASAVSSAGPTSAASSAAKAKTASTSSKDEEESAAKASKASKTAKAASAKSAASKSAAAKSDDKALSTEKVSTTKSAAKSSAKTATKAASKNTAAKSDAAKSTASSSKATAKTKTAAAASKSASSSKSSSAASSAATAASSVSSKDSEVKSTASASKATKTAAKATKSTAATAASTAKSAKESSAKVSATAKPSKASSSKAASKDKSSVARHTKSVEDIKANIAAALKSSAKDSEEQKAVEAKETTEKKAVIKLTTKSKARTQGRAQSVADIKADLAANLKSKSKAQDTAAKAAEEKVEAKAESKAAAKSETPSVAAKAQTKKTTAKASTKTKASAQSRVQSAASIKAGIAEALKSSAKAKDDVKDGEANTSDKEAKKSLIKVKTKSKAGRAKSMADIKADLVENLKSKAKTSDEGSEDEPKVNLKLAVTRKRVIKPSTKSKASTLSRTKTSANIKAGIAEALKSSAKAKDDVKDGKALSDAPNTETKGSVIKLTTKSKARTQGRAKSMADIKADLVANLKSKAKVQDNDPEMEPSVTKPTSILNKKPNTGSLFGAGGTSSSVRNLGISSAITARSNAAQTATAEQKTRTAESSVLKSDSIYQKHVAKDGIGKAGNNIAPVNIRREQATLDLNPKDNKATERGLKQAAALGKSQNSTSTNSSESKVSSVRNNSKDES